MLRADTKKAARNRFASLFAESEGFKPPVQQSRTADFESAPIDHSGNFPVSFAFCSAKLRIFPIPPNFIVKKLRGELKYGLPVGINHGGFSWTYCPRIAPRCLLTARGTTGRVLAKRAVCFIFASAKRGRAQAFPLFAF